MFKTISNLILGTSLSLLTKEAEAADKTCNLWQVCADHDDCYPINGDGKTLKMPTGKCDDPSKVTVPVFPTGGFEPAPITDSTGVGSFATACPFLDATQPLCCNSDTAQIMEYNYRSLDAVFNTDCPVCAVNLKTMWCMYACDPDKARFLTDLGTKTTAGQLYSLVGFAIDSDYACGVFTSCAKVSFIAQAGISSSLAFLDFLGVNGQDYSLSVITFTLAKDEPSTSLTPYNTGDPYDCATEVPSTGLLNGYTSITNSTCSYCDAACEAPAVNDDIALLDGLSWKMVGWSYVGFIIFTIVFQILVHFVFNRSKGAAGNQDESAGGSNVSGAQGDRGYGGRPVNMTTSEASKTNLESDKLLE